MAGAFDGVKQTSDFFSAQIEQTDPQLAEFIRNEAQRQSQKIELIASENIVSQAVKAAQGSVLTNKYAEGYPGRRYYGGCEHVDEVERLAIARVTELCNCKFANVQPHSGSQANQAAFMALMQASIWLDRRPKSSASSAVSPAVYCSRWSRSSTGALMTPRPSFQSVTPA